jgi:hypothetical protein
MRRLIADSVWLCAAAAAALVGHGWGQGVAAQSPAPRPGPSFQSVIPAPSLNQPVPLWPNQPSETTYWSIADIRKAHQTLAAADKAGRTLDPNRALHDFPYWTRTHALFVAHVEGHPAAGRSAAQHAGYAQFIVIMGGSGTVVAGGTLEDRVALAEGGREIPGEWRGAAIAGGETFTVSEGDWLSIPPDTPAQFKADASGLTYMVMKINAMLYPWDLVR